MSPWSNAAWTTSPASCKPAALCGREVLGRRRSPEGPRFRSVAPVITLHDDLAQKLANEPRHWLVTGAAGFIGSHLLETLLRHGQKVTTLDNFATGHQRNLDEVRALVGEAAWQNHRFIQGDIADVDTCKSACEGVDVVLHQAVWVRCRASIADPLNTHRANATGFLNMLVAARDAGAKRLCMPRPAPTYGDSPTLPKVEDVIGNPCRPTRSPSTSTSCMRKVLPTLLRLRNRGLRYFNVFGPAKIRMVPTPP